MGVIGGFQRIEDTRLEIMRNQFDSSLLDIPYFKSYRSRIPNHCKEDEAVHNEKDEDRAVSLVTWIFRRYE